MGKRKMPQGIDEFFLRSGFHKHKQSKQKRGLYFSIGGFDITKDDAINIYRTHQVQELAAIAYTLDTISKIHALLGADLQEQIDDHITGLKKQLQEIQYERGNVK